MQRTPRSRRRRRISRTARPWRVLPGGDSAAPLALLRAPARADRFATCLPIILSHEGGYVDHPRDPGGATNRGITIRTLADWRGRPVTKAEVKALTVEEAGAIYRARYWAPLRCGDLPPGVDLMVFDFGVNAGIGRSARMLQSAVGASADGQIGPATLAAVRRQQPGTLVNRLAEARLGFYRRLPTFSTFGAGWTSRTSDVRRKALAMASQLGI